MEEASSHSAPLAYTSMVTVPSVYLLASSANIFMPSVMGLPSGWFSASLKFRVGPISAAASAQMHTMARARARVNSFFIVGFLLALYDFCNALQNHFDAETMRFR